MLEFLCLKPLSRCQTPNSILTSSVHIMRKYFELIILIAVLGFVAFSRTQQQNETPYVILISFDGFRHDYVEKFDAQNFKEFIKDGAAAKHMYPSFPSKTFPNHYSLVTGLYPGNHGLVDNSFYDREMDLEYRISNREMVENPDFYGGLPLWQLAQQNGMKSASYFWVGSEAPVAGSFPDYYHIYDGKISNETRIEGVIDWLELPEAERPHFISLYFSLVDSQGHATGPDAKETGESVQETDRLLGLLMKQLETVDLPVNVIVTSDHGMNAVPETDETLLTVEGLLMNTDKKKFKFVNNGAHAHLYVHESEDIQQIYETLNRKDDRYSVYKKEDLPAKWHFNNDRVGDILITVKSGHYLTNAFRKRQMIQRGATQGQHGFDPYTTPDMGAIFYAKGPNIKPGSRIDSLENVDVYPFVAHILGITKLPPIDGNVSGLMSLYQQ